MKFLTVKRQSRPRKDGRESASAYIIQRSRKFGPVLEQTGISIRKPILITGPHAAGKSRALKRLHENSSRIWASIDAEPIYLVANRPISAWTAGKHLDLWWKNRYACNDGDFRSWDKLKAWERVDYLPAYLSETGALLFIDDAHLLSGQKLKLAQACTESARIWIISTADEIRLSPSLRTLVLRAEPQIIRFGSDVAYDATGLFVWCLILISLGMGYYELSMAAGALKVLASGRRAAKQH